MHIENHKEEVPFSFYEEKFKGILAEEGAEIISEENWGLKKLAVSIATSASF